MILIKKSFILSLIILSLLAFKGVNAYSFDEKSGLEKSGENAGISSVMGGFNDDLPGFIGRIIAIVLSVMGIIFLGLTVYGGFIWMLARGDQSEVEKALSIIKNSFIGIVIVLAAYALTKFIYLAFFPVT